MFVAMWGLSRMKKTYVDQKREIKELKNELASIRKDTDAINQLNKR